MLLIFLGPPGSGKGTQAKIISKQYNLKHVSTGDMLRETAKSGSELGFKLAEIMSRGELVTDDLVNEIVQETLSKPEYQESIIDGYPRTLAQAQFLDNILPSKYIVINFKIDIAHLKSRIESRFVCKGCNAIYNEASTPLKVKGVCDVCGSKEFEYRADDNEQSLLKRVEVYQGQIIDILDFYLKQNKLVEVDASRSIEEVTKYIVESISI